MTTWERPAAGSSARRLLPPAAFAAALASVPGASPAVLADAIGRWGPEGAWDRAVAGLLGADAEPVAQLRLGHAPLDLGDAPVHERGGLHSGAAWARAAAGVSVAAVWDLCRERAIGVTWLGSPDYPVALVGDPAPPGVLFHRGSLACLSGPCVAIVGTRQCTPEGASVAFELGADLAAAGVCVVSGFALGVDGAAHAGALAARADGAGGTTAGVAASGVDVPYPARHRALWERAALEGTVVSETPPGRSPQSWRFPARNRIIAALVRMVVVVECHASGGSLHTVDAAIRRGIEVGAVPGSVRSPASVGTNRLLSEGCVPVRSARDIFEALSLSGYPSLGAPLPAGAAQPGREAALDVVASRVLAALGGRPCPLDQLIEHSGLSARTVVVALERLEGQGRVKAGPGWWVRASPIR